MSHHNVNNNTAAKYKQLLEQQAIIRIQMHESSDPSEQRRLQEVASSLEVDRLVIEDDNLSRASVATAAAAASAPTTASRATSAALVAFAPVSNSSARAAVSSVGTAAAAASGVCRTLIPSGTAHLGSL